MWFFQSPKIVFGEDALDELNQLQGKRAFVVTDATMHQLGFLEMILERLRSAGFETSQFSQVEPDPAIETVKTCATELTSFAPDWVIGLGGGSCLDAAKAAWFLYECPEVDLAAINPFETFGLRTKARFLTISTTSGTGADVSWGFALNDPETQTKLVRVSRELIPDIAIVDPRFVVGLPPQVTGDAGMDVLAHAVEAYTNTWHNDFTDPLALKAIQLVFEYLPKAYYNGKDAEAREHMHNAATMAGLAFSNTAIILAHTLAHAVGATFHTHHGKTVGMFLPYTIQYNAKVFAKRYAEIAHTLHLPAATDEEGVQSLVKAIQRLAGEIDQPHHLHDMGIEADAFEAALPHLVENAMNSLELLANPRQPDESDLLNLFMHAYHGKPVDF